MQLLRFAVTMTICWSGLSAAAAAQQRPNLSGIWRLDPAASRMIGPDGAAAPANLRARQITWLVDHQEPDIVVVATVRDATGSHEFSFRCAINGAVCANQLPALSELRRTTAAWDGAVLVMTHTAETPQGAFTTRDRAFLADSGQTLVFEHVVPNAQGDRPVRQVFRKLGPHPSQRANSPEPLPSVELSAALERVLREYERHWRAGHADSLAALFTEDGMIANRGGWIRGRGAIRQAYDQTSSELRLRAVAYAIEDRVAYIMGAYGYGSGDSVADRGMFILALRRDSDGKWLIAADLDGSMRR